jgi:Na+-transporting methylmalonyl-CoA/oxaloacetate decarboxylase gamma subunit
MNIFSIAMMIIYVFVLIYVVQLLGRFVRAVERIATTIESYFKT